VTAATMLGSVMPRRSRAWSRYAFIAIRIDSVPPVVKAPTQPEWPWYRLMTIWITSASICRVAGWMAACSGLVNANIP